MLKLRNVEFGAGMPAIIVPVMGSDESDVIEQALAAVSAGAECIEWRADFFTNLKEESISSCLGCLRGAIGDIPLLFTLRSASQGGRAQLPDEQLFQLVGVALATGEIDLVDVELDCAVLPQLVDMAHELGVAVLVSQHDFARTPGYDDLYSIFEREAEAGADVAKLAVMAQAEGDELRLMAAAHQFSTDKPSIPLVAISMGELGLITRVAGEFFGSVATFCTVGQASAPGQIDIALARKLIAQLHESGYNSLSTE